MTAAHWIERRGSFTGLVGQRVTAYNYDGSEHTGLLESVTYTEGTVTLRIDGRDIGPILSVRPADPKVGP